MKLNKILNHTGILSIHLDKTQLEIIPEYEFYEIIA